MIRKIDHNKMGRSEQGWLTSWFHFSFAEYYNPKNISFGALRVINDDLIAPHTGFGTHPHKDMEIVSYVVNGGLTHADSMNNRHTLQRGEVQYMSAGTGITHSELNDGDETVRLLQIWILPDKKNYTPQYGDYRFAWGERDNRWLSLVSDEGGDAPIKIHQDMHIFAASLTDGKSLEFPVKPGRQAYLVLIEGAAELNGVPLSARDAAEISSEQLVIKATPDAHILILEMAKKA